MPSFRYQKKNWQNSRCTLLIGSAIQLSSQFDSLDANSLWTVGCDSVASFINFQCFTIILPPAVAVVVCAADATCQCHGLRKQHQSLVVTTPPFLSQRGLIALSESLSLVGRSSNSRKSSVGLEFVETKVQQQWIVDGVLRQHFSHNTHHGHDNCPGKTTLQYCGLCAKEPSFPKRKTCWQGKRAHRLVPDL